MNGIQGIHREERNGFFSSLSINIKLISINVILFFVFTLLISSNSAFLNYVAIKPANIFGGHYLWTFLTSMFMHANFFHLFVNMFSLFFVGSLLETIIGKRRYLWFYLSSGVFAGLFFAFLSYFFGSGIIGMKLFGSPSIYAVGASGAIFAIVGVLAVLIPGKRVSLLAGPIVAIVIQAILGEFIINSSLLSTINVLVTIYIFLCIFAMFSFRSKLSLITLPLEMPFWILPAVAIVPLFIIGYFFPLPIGNTAHLGGLIAGLIYGLYLRNKYKNKTRYISRYFS